MIENTNQTNNRFQVLITGIKWDKEPISAYYVKHDNYNDLPLQFTLDLPENIMNQISKKKTQEEANDAIETFVYNFLTKKYGHEVTNCQIWLPLEEKNQ